jgi:ribosomal protein S12 methylthiotransferase accessory factor
MLALSRQLDGLKDTQAVIENLSRSYDRPSIKRIMETMLMYGVIGDSRFLAQHLIGYSENPSPYYNDLSPQAINNLIIQSQKKSKPVNQKHSSINFEIKPTFLTKIISKRKSCRTFSENNIPHSDLFEMLWACYGMTPGQLIIADSKSIARRTVPSAGALYPLEISLALFRDSDNIPAGIYKVSYPNAYCVSLIKCKTNVDKLYDAFIDPIPLLSAQGAIVISGSYNFCSKKYANRSLLYVTVEAGHCAQNVYLIASQKRIGICETGGFIEERIKNSIDLSNDMVPITSLIFGYPSLPNKFDQNIVIQWSNNNSSVFKTEFTTVFAKPENKRSEWACGRSFSRKEALVKAISEAIEWNAFENVDKMNYRRYDPYSNKFILPTVIAKYHPDQYSSNNFPFTPFLTTSKYEWVKVKDLVSEDPKFVLSDFIFYPHNPKHKKYSQANSSGTSIHLTFDKAVNHALHELIERDSFMILWLNRLILPAFKEKSLPTNILKRIETLKKASYSIVIKNATLDLAPVVLIVARSKKVPSVFCAAASSFDLGEALERSLLEIEAGVSSFLQARESNISRPKILRPFDVKNTEDHSRLYQNIEYIKKSDFLFYSSSYEEFSFMRRQYLKKASHSLNEFVSLITKEPIYFYEPSVKETYSGLHNNHVTLRVLAPGLIPMSFGYELEPCGLDRIYSVPVNLKLIKDKISYKKLNRFPHPFN